MAWLAGALQAKGHEVHYLNASGVSDNRDGIRYVCTSEKPWHYIADGQRSIQQSLKFAYQLRKIVREISPEVIYSVQAPIFSIFSLHFMRRKTWFLIVEWIEIWSRDYWNHYLGKLTGSIGYLIQTAATRLGDLRVTFTQRCYNLVGGNKNSKVLLPGLHMNPTRESSTPFFKRNDITFLGRFVAEKQPLLALKVISTLVEQGWKGKFHLIGSGPLESEIQKEIKKLNLNQVVNLQVNAPQEVLENCLTQSFVLLHPSRREGYGLAMIEAAEKCIPTILINYPENASVDLDISPMYVSEDDSVLRLAKLVNQALANQKADWHRLSEWKIKTLPTMSAVNSVNQLLDLIEDRNHPQTESFGESDV
jgi:glycosyltransferase involved in cell wall biosynthesis